MWCSDRDRCGSRNWVRKVTPESVVETHVQVNGLGVPKQNLRDATIVSLGAQSHPRGLVHELDSLTRARLCHVQHPHRVMSGWTAAAQWVLEYFVDAADTSALAGGVSTVAASSSEIPRRRKTRVLAQIPTYRINPEFRDLQVTPPVLTLIHCLKSLWSGEHSWNIPVGAGLTDARVRAVQLVGAMSRIFGIDPQELPEVCAHHLDRRRMEVLTNWCDQGGDSPMETLMRPMARLDLGCEELKPALQYDGPDISTGRCGTTIPGSMRSWRTSTGMSSG